MKIKHYLLPEMVFTENGKWKWIYKRKHGLFIKTDYPLWDRYLTKEEEDQLIKEFSND